MSYTVCSPRGRFGTQLHPASVLPLLVLVIVPLCQFTLASLIPDYVSANREYLLIREKIQDHQSTSYCQASVPTSNTYQELPNHRLRKVLIFARHGDRSPSNIIWDDIDSHITWDCGPNEYTFLDDTIYTRSSHLSSNNNDDLDIKTITHDSSPLLAKRVNLIDGKTTWHPQMWHGSCTQGELTSRGHDMLVDFGKRLRDIYVDKLHFLPNQLDLTTIRVRSTDLPRTLRSAQSVVDGLFPASLITNDNTMGRQVNIFTLPAGVDPLHSNKLNEHCPKQASLLTDIKKTPIWSTFIDDSLQTFAWVAALAPLKLSPRQFNSPLWISSITDKKASPGMIENLMARICWDKPLPCASITEARNRFISHVIAGGKDKQLAQTWADKLIKQYYSNKEEGVCLNQEMVETAALYKAIDFYLRNNYYPNRSPTNDLLILEIGPLLREILSIIDPHPQNIDESLLAARMHMFITHDGTISALLGALRATPELHDWPAYRSNVIIEVWEHEISNIPVVRVLVNGKPIQLDPFLHDNPCPDLGFGSCLLRDFFRDLQSRSAEDWEAACENISFTYQ